MRKAVFLIPHKHACDPFDACGPTLEERYLTFYYLYFGIFHIRLYNVEFTHQGYDILLYLIIHFMICMRFCLELRNSCMQFHSTHLNSYIIHLISNKIHGERTKVKTMQHKEMLILLLMLS